jgi:SAM-dependent methyltransferase
MSPGYSGKISYRRWLLNECLARYSNVFFGASVVLDVGGKRELGTKGFQYPVENAGTWINLNIEAKTNPDVVADATRLPLPDNSVDVVVCTEVLEHLNVPTLCIDEIWRVVKSGGMFIGSAPFVFPVHGDPNDYYRYTESGLRSLLCKFSAVEIESMGGSLGTIGLLLEQELTTLSRSRLMRSLIRRFAITLSRKDYKENFRGSARLTTGWFWRCTK